ncbi:MAG TPA: cupin domain-containing protein [Chryseosolibacter sp.]|nr:cupin domain-containing protein [Chryseosolibacter sp.]
MEPVAKVDVAIPAVLSHQELTANNLQKFDSVELKEACDYLAPDGSEIRLLLTLQHGGVCHCTLPPGLTSTAVKHKTVEEIWYVLSGEGEMWRKNNEQEEVIRMKHGTCLSIPLETSFQFRNTGEVNLTLLITTMPPWPGKDEAVVVKDHWTISK